MSDGQKPTSWAVVILTHNEPSETILLCLRSVRRAADSLCLCDPVATVQIRVVDDSAPDHRAEWEEVAAGLGVELVHFRGTIAEKRNTGWREVDSDIVVFTDADCEVDERWLIEHANAYAVHPESAGVVGLTIHKATKSLAQTAMRQAGFLVGYSFPEIMRETLWGPCSNLSFRVAMLSKVGGFDEIFSCSAEDVDLGLRVCALTGKRLVCAREAIVQHAGMSSVQELWRRAWRWGAGEALLLSRHADYRVTAPPHLWLFLTMAVALALTDFFLQGRVSSLVFFVLVYVIGGPLQESREAGVSWIAVLESRVLRILFHFRSCLSLLSTGQFLLIGNTMNYGEGQFAHDWPYATRNLWEFLLFLLLFAAMPR